MTEIIEERVPDAVGAVRTFLIADVRGYTRYTVEQGDEAAARLAARFAAVTRETVAAHEGEVIELRGDEALAAFSSARRALRAAVALVDAFAAEPAADPAAPIKIGVGLDAGEAVPVEGGYRGAALNLASRLCSLAGPGEVLASEGVTHLARKVDGLVYGERGAVQLKGFDTPVKVVEVRLVSEGEQAPGQVAVLDEGGGRELPIGSYLGALPANRVVGRAAEMDRLLQVIGAVSGGRGRLLLLAGEPGAGKTRLAQEVTLALHHRDFVMAAGRCYEPQQSVPYFPFLEALTALYAAAPPDIRADVPRRWSELARLLPALGLPIAGHAGTQDQQRLFWAVTGFVQTLAQRSPVALLLDDLHWADAASLALLQHLARHTSGDRVFLLGTYRDVEVNRQHPLEAALRDLGREGLIERLEVRRLSWEETRDLIAAVLGQEEISEEFAGLLYRRTEGNAFFVEQVLHAMVERGDIYRKDGRWDRKRIDEIEVPESVRSVVGQRLSRLAPETQEILREASVLGQAFRFDELLAMSGRPEAELERRLDEAMAAGMVRDAGRDRYGFDHALTQAALHAELSGRRRRRWHLAAGQALEDLPDDRREERAGELAWHFLEGDDPARALRWSLAAGGGAERVYAHSDAEYHYRTALQLACEEGDRDQEMVAREKLGEVLSRLARHDEALEIYEPAVRFYQCQGDFGGQIRVMAAIGWIMFEQGRREEGLQRLRPLLQRWEQAPVVAASAVSLHIALGNLYWHAGWVDDGLALLERAAQMAAEVGDEGLLGIVESRRALFLEHVDRMDEALEAYTRSIPLLEAGGDLDMLIRTFNNRSLIYASQARHSEARSDLERALAVARRLGDPAQIGWALGILATVHWARAGDWTAAQAYVEELGYLAPRIKGTRAGSFVAAGVGMRLIMGDRSALSELESLAEEAARDGEVALLWAAQEGLARWDLLQGNEERALGRYEELLQNPGIESQHRVELERWLARALVATGNLVRAELLVTQGMQRDRRLGQLFGRQPWLIVQGSLRGAQGRWAEARADIEEALRIARAGRFMLNTGETHLAYGEILARQGDREAARRQLEEARQIFQEMHAVAYVGRTERALAGLG